MADLKETMELFEEKKKEIDAKYGVKLQQIASLAADLEAAPTELAGQSEAYINRKTEKLRKRISKKQEAAEKWVKDKTKEVEDWLAKKKEEFQEKVIDEAKTQAEILELKLKLQIAAALAAKTGVELPDLPETEIPDETPSVLPAAPEKFDDDKYDYYYKTISGVIVKAKSGEEAAKRKAYPIAKIYTDPADKLNTVGLRREPKMS